MKYDYASSFERGFADVVINDKWGLVDKTGREVIPVIYDEPINFQNGLAWTKSNGKTVIYDHKANQYNSRDEALAIFGDMTLSDYLAAENFGSFDDYLSSQGIAPLTKDALAAKVQAEIEVWQKKGEFESTAKWKDRVTEATRAAKAQEIAKRINDEYTTNFNAAQKRYQDQYKSLARELCDRKTDWFKTQDMTLMPYDADNETFLISTEKVGDILLRVPADEAPEFKAKWENPKEYIHNFVHAYYVPTGNDVALESVYFGLYKYDSNTKADYALTDVDYNFRPLDLSAIDYNFAPIDDGSAATTVATTPGKTVQPKTVTPEVRHVQGGTLADVDTDIPQGTHKADKTFAVIIANGNYEHASTVGNAANDGSSMEKYLTRTLGIPANQVKTFHDATFGKMTTAVAYLKDIAKAYSNEPFNVIFYYVGHGLPDDAEKEAYLLPVDVKPSYTSACYSVNQLYKDLAELNAANVTVMIDACFSGSNYGDGMLVPGSMGAVMKAKPMAPKGNMVVLTATQGDQTAYPYEEKGHGLFTYYILKKLQETRGDVTLGELSEYVTDRVSKTSVTINSKLQTPATAVSPTLAPSWRTLHLER